MPATLTSPTTPTLPEKSYLPQARRDVLMREGDTDLLYIAESQEARDAGDMDTAWRWLALADVPAHTLMFLKDQYGAQFIRDFGFDTTAADAQYGAGWLNRD